MKTIELEQVVSFKNILLGTDFSEVSKKALPYAEGIARLYGSKVHLVHVIPPVTRVPIPMEALPLELDYSLQNAERDMQTFLRGDLLACVPHEERIERGPILDTLTALIRQGDIDLLILGTHGRGGLKKVILGSVAEELFRLASCPVLTVGPNVPGQGAAEFRRILFATDFGPSSSHALPCAISLVAQSKAKLTLLHVVLPVPVVDVGPHWYVGNDLAGRQQIAKARYIDQLKEMIPAHTDLPCEPELLVDFDFAPDSILRVAADIRADLIVMGVNQAASARASAHLPWATAHEVVCHAHCPVLTVRS
jgi:nucleotide-binding universal stress UspA family protein